MRCISLSLLTLIIFLSYLDCIHRNIPWPFAYVLGNSVGILTRLQATVRIYVFIYTLSYYSIGLYMGYALRNRQWSFHMFIILLYNWSLSYLRETRVEKTIEVHIYTCEFLQNMPIHCGSIPHSVTLVSAGREKNTDSNHSSCFRQGYDT